MQLSRYCNQILMTRSAPTPWSRLISFPLMAQHYKNIHFIIIIILILPAVVGVVICHTILEEYHCKDSEVQYGVSLKGGKKAGVFRPLGKTKTIQVCLL